jgi:hypothetical protein
MEPFGCKHVKTVNTENGNLLNPEIAVARLKIVIAKISTLGLVLAHGTHTIRRTLDVNNKLVHAVRTVVSFDRLMYSGNELVLGAKGDLSDNRGHSP